MLQPFQIEICDSSGHVLAVAEITDESQGYFLGRITRDEFPEELRSLLEEYEEIVAGQMLSLLDDVEAKLRAWGLRVGGIPGHVSSALVIDFQPEPEGGFALRVE